MNQLEKATARFAINVADASRSPGSRGRKAARCSRARIWRTSSASDH